MSRPLTFSLAVLFLATAATPLLANPLFSDNFESYAQGTLDKNYAPGPNAAPNGSGQPWFGPVPPNIQVVPTENAITPTSGTQMIRGSAPSDLDQQWYNLPYRLNAGNVFTGNIRLDFKFYDTLGAGGSTMRDFGAIAFYNTVPTTTDHPDNGSLNTGATQIQRISIGGSSSVGAGFDANFYQARIVGASDGYNANGWFNTAAPRTVGWHAMRIDVGPVLPDGTNDLAFFVDNMTTPVLSHNSVISYGGYNAIELNMNFGATSAYVDDLSFSVRTTGDVNLDAKIDGDDYALLDVGFNTHLTGYTHGDLNADGTINAADYLILDTAYGHQSGLSPDLLEKRLGQFGPDYVSTLVAAVPEPTSLFAACGLAVGLVRRCRR